MSPLVVLVALTGVLVAGLAIAEGAVVARCIGAGLPGGARRLERLGVGFVASEVWAVALLGTAHGAFGGMWHALVPFALVPASVALVGWLLRDVGLWLGPRLGAGAAWRWLIAAGAAVQATGALAVVVGVAVGWASGGVPTPLAPGAASSPVALQVLASVLPVALGVGVVLQLTWWVRLRDVRVPGFAWVAPPRADVDRAIPATSGQHPPQHQPSRS